MRTFTWGLGGTEVTIVAPQVGLFDRAAFDEAFPYGAMYGLDVEGTYMDDLGQWSDTFGLRLIQFATKQVGWVLNLVDPAQREAAVALLSDTTTSFCSHTNMDVLSVATRLGVDITCRNVDTRSLAIMAFPEERAERDLKTLTAQHIGPELGEAEAILHGIFDELWPGRKNAKRSEVHANGWLKVDADEEAYLVYAGLDAIACRQLVEILIPLTQAPARLVEMEVWLEAQSNRIQLRGMRLDLAVLDELQSEAQHETSTADAQIREITGGILARSPKLHGWLAEHGVDWSGWQGATTDKGNPSLAKDNVKLLLDFPLDEQGRQVADALINFKAHQDALNKTMGVRKYLTSDLRLHPLLNPMGATTTARMSSASPNFQNFSKKDPRMRGLFLPDPGHVLLTIDFEQVELRVVAALAREQKMIDVITSGGDLHQLTVDELASVGVTITRDQAKIVNFLIVYGGGGSALHDQTGIPLEEANAIVRAHRERYPAIADLKNRLGNLSEVRTISHRRLPVTFNKAGEPRSYANVNYLVQSSARELLVDAWWRLAVEFGRGDCVWYPVHDELVLQAPIEELLDVADAAERCLRFDFMGVPISATAELLLEADGSSRWMVSKRAGKIREAAGFTAENYDQPERAYMQAFARGELTGARVAA